MAATVWKGHLSFGLVSIPVRLYRAARAEKVSFRQLHWTAAAQDQAPQPETPVAEPNSHSANSTGGHRSDPRNRTRHSA